jgi:hypothetical protein
MKDILDRIRALSSVKFSKGKLDEAREVSSAVAARLEEIGPSSDHEDVTAEFEDITNELEAALDALDSGCDALEDAEGKEERDEALDEIAGALAEVSSSLAELAKISISAPPEREKFDKDFLEFIQECFKKSPSSYATDVEQWIAAASDASARLGRRAAKNRFEEAAAKNRRATT